MQRCCFVQIARSFTLKPTNGFQHETVVAFLRNSLYYDVVLFEEQLKYMGKKKI